MGYTIGLCLKNKKNIQPIAEYFKNYPLFEIYVEIHEKTKDDNFIFSPDISISYGPGSFHPPKDKPLDINNHTRELFDRLLAYISFTYGKVWDVPDSNEKTHFWLYDGNISTMKILSCDGDTFVFQNENFRKLNKKEKLYYFEEDNSDELDNFYYIEGISEIDAQINEQIISNFIIYEKKVRLIK